MKVAGCFLVALAVPAGDSTATGPSRAEVNVDLENYSTNLWALNVGGPIAVDETQGAINHPDLLPKIAREEFRNASAADRDAVVAFLHPL
jgi:hypothetical protein